MLEQLASVPRALRNRRRFSVSSGVSRICAADDAVLAERFLIRMDQLHLARRGRRLQIFKRARRLLIPSTVLPIAIAPDETISTSWPSACKSRYRRPGFRASRD